MLFSGSRFRLFSFPAFLALLLAAASLAIACGGDDDDDGGDSPDAATPTATSETGETAEPEPDDNGDGDDAPSGSGSGTLEVDGQTIAFDVAFCGFGPDETGNDDVSFSLSGSGTADDGTEFLVDGSIVSVAGSEFHNAELFLNEAPYDYLYTADLFGDAEFEIDGKSVLLSTNFLAGVEETDVGAGVFEATCP